MLAFENGATSKIDDVLTEHGGLLHVLTRVPKYWLRSGDNTDKAPSPA